MAISPKPTSGQRLIGKRRRRRRSEEAVPCPLVLKIT
jgi:hypothetical protein